VVYAVCRRDGWGTGNFCNVGEDAVETFENFGVGISGDVKYCADGLVDAEVGKVFVDSEPMESIPAGGGHGNDKVWGSPCAWA